jgi:autotransporter-associated beta strand protein/T5SS/PEP-CTERM-associated repeat protein
LGPGSTTLAGSSTYGGATTVGGGILRVTTLADTGSASSIGTNGIISLANGGVLEYVGSTNASLNRGLNLAAGHGGVGVSNGVVALTIGGVISNAGSFIKSGEGTLVLSAANTFSGTATIAAGTLSLRGSGALPSSTALILSSGSARLDISEVATAGATNGSLAGAAGSTVNLGQKNLTVGGDDSNTSFGGVISNAGSLTKIGAGTMILTGENLHTGGTTVAQGTLFLDAENVLPDGRVLTVTGSNSVLLSSTSLNIGSSASEGSLVVTNGGDVITSSGYIGGAPTAANNMATVSGEGSSWLNENFLYVGYEGTSNELVITSGGVVAAGWFGVIGSESTSASNKLTVSGAGSSFSTSGELIVGSYGSGNRMFVDSGATVQNLWSGTIGYIGSSNSVVVSGGSSLWTNGGEVYIGYFGTENSLTVSDDGSVAAEYGVYIASQFESSGALNFGRFATNDSAGTLVTPRIGFGDGEGAINFNQTNATALSASISGAGTIRQLGSGSTILLGENTYSGATLILGGMLKIGDGGTNGTLGSGAVTNEALLIVDRSDDIQVDNIISGAGAVTKLGHGTLTLTGSNNYAGGFSLASGAVRAQSGSAFGSGFVTQADGGSRLIIDTTEEVTNQMSIFYLQAWQTVTLSGSKTINNATYDVTNNTTTTESGDLTGSGGITKLGVGTLVLSGSNNYTGAITVQAGVLGLASTAGQAAGSAASVEVMAEATLLISQSNQVNDSAVVTLSGGTIRRGAGVSEVFGNLNIADASTLDFGLGAAGNFRFQEYINADSALVTVNNFLPGNSMQFLTNSFSAANLSQLNFGGAGYNTSIQGNYFTITAIPEPSTWIVIAGLLSLFIWPTIRRALRPQSHRSS